MRDVPSLDELKADASGDNVPGKPFGYATAMRKRAIRERLLAEGVTDPTTLFFAVERGYEAECRHDLTFRQRQDLAKWLGLSWASPPAAHTAVFTSEELEYIAERLGSANSPLGRSVLSKIGQLLG